MAALGQTIRDGDGMPERAAVTRRFPRLSQTPRPLPPGRESSVEDTLCVDCDLHLEQFPVHPAELAVVDQQNDNVGGY